MFDDPNYSVTTFTLDKLAKAFKVHPAKLVEFFLDEALPSSMKDEKI